MLHTLFVIAMVVSVLHTLQSKLNLDINIDVKSGISVVSK